MPSKIEGKVLEDEKNKVAHIKAQSFLSICKVKYMLLAIKKDVNKIEIDNNPLEP